MKSATWTRRALFWAVGLAGLTLLAVEHRADAWGIGVHVLLLAACVVLLWLLLQFDDAPGRDNDH
ncbi:MAG: hypothetical protein KIT17_01455 [Rubrivivax sp.]|nr:hypothetical protein [Rubrivivax sp.]